VDWRVKVAAHWVVSAVPPLGYQLQRHVTHSLPLPESSFQAHVSAAARHLAMAREVLGRDPDHAYEYGAGWDLLVPLAMARAGVRRQTVVDVRRLVRAELVDDAARRLGIAPDPEALGIAYVAPIDTTATGLPESSFDLIHSTDTLEHVPVDQLRPLLVECHRLLAPGGAFTALVDYVDHYHHADHRLPPFNFRRYGTRTWRLLNPPSHFQSRITHQELVDAIASAGFHLRSVEVGELAGEPASSWISATREVAAGVEIPREREPGVRS
jgi:SAM-dependent methyltransferase